MPSELLAPGTAAATSSTFTLAQGETATVFLTSDDGVIPLGAAMTVQAQRSTAAWVDVYAMRGPDRVIVQIPGPGVFRIRRSAPGVTPYSVGAERA